MIGIIFRIYYSLFKYKKADTFNFGHPIYKDDQNQWRYLNDNKLFDFDTPRPCSKCKKEKPISGHDPCIQKLPGVRFACCGHGLIGKDYVTLVSGKRMSLKAYKKLKN